MNQTPTQRASSSTQSTAEKNASIIEEGSEEGDDNVVELNPMPFSIVSSADPSLKSSHKPSQSKLRSCLNRFKYYFEYKAPGRKGINGNEVLEVDTLGNWLSAIVVFVILVPVMLATSTQLVIIAGNLYDFTGPGDWDTVKLFDLVIVSLICVLVLLVTKILIHIFFRNASHRGILNNPSKSMLGLNLFDLFFDGVHLALQIEVLVALQNTNRLAYFIFVFWLIHRAMCWISQRGQYSVYFFLVLIDTVFYAAFTFPILAVEVHFLSKYADAVASAGVPVINSTQIPL